jgi:GxxExxY protein
MNAKAPRRQGKKEGREGNQMPYEDEDPSFGYVEPDAEVDALARAVIGAAIEVHRRYGPGLDEALYQNALCVEFRLRDIPYVKEVIIKVEYKGEIIGERRLDFIVGGKLVVELKAVEQLLPLHKAQVLTYLKITGLKLGLLINFNVEVLKHGIRRVICP